MTEARKLPTVQEFCVALPLYAEHTLTAGQKTTLYNFITQAVSIDCFCVDCQQPSVFLGVEQPIGVKDYDFELYNRVFMREFLCSRVHAHSAFFYFRLKRSVLCKVGQSPSMADISESALRPYRKVLAPEEYRELTRAVGLASHGVGIGSFVYLRRIFERLIGAARDQASGIQGWDEQAFQRSRMEEKIDLLQHFLPPFLVEQRKLYSILSKGIHALTEEECLEAFPIVRVGIELILDQKVAAKQQEEKIEEAKKRFGSLQQKLTGP
jgi:hypothetical protein